MRCDVATIDGFSDVSASQNLQNVGLENSLRAQNFVIPNGMLVCIRFRGWCTRVINFPRYFLFSLILRKLYVLAKTPLFTVNIQHRGSSRCLKCIRLSLSFLLSLINMLA